MYGLCGASVYLLPLGPPRDPPPLGPPRPLPLGPPRPRPLPIGAVSRKQYETLQCIGKTFHICGECVCSCVGEKLV